jgi:hypothetical protein
VLTKATVIKLIEENFKTNLRPDLSTKLNSQGKLSAAGNAIKLSSQSIFHQTRFANLCSPVQ